MKNLFFLFAILFFSFPIVAQNIIQGQVYYIQSNASGRYLKVQGTNVVQSSNTNISTAEWKIESRANGRYAIVNVNSGKFLSVNQNSPGVGGKRLEMTLETSKAKWELSGSNDKLRIKSGYRNVYVSTLDKRAEGTYVNQAISPGNGSWWKLVPKNSGGDNTSSPITTLQRVNSVNTSPSGADYGSVTLSANANAGGQNIVMNKSYDISLAKGALKLDGVVGGEIGKWLLIATKGTPSFNTGYDGQNDNNGWKEGYFIEKMNTNIRILSNDVGAEFHTALPLSSSQEGSTGFSEGFSVGVKGSGGVKGEEPTVNVSFSAGYSQSKSGGLKWGDFKVDKKGEGTSSVAHEYVIHSLKGQQGGAVPYTDYRDFKNTKDLVLKPLHHAPDRAYGNFGDIYEYYIIELPANATGFIELELSASMTANLVEWNGGRVVQNPELLSQSKRIRINLSDVTSTISTEPLRVKTVASNRFWHLNGLADQLLSSRFQTTDDYSRFIFELQNDGSYRIKVKATDKYLHANDSGSNDKLVSTRFSSNDDYTRFFLEEQADGAFRIKVKATGKYLHANDGGGNDRLISTRYQSNDNYTKFILEY